MRPFKQSLQSQGFIWEFAVDGGAKGTIDSGLILPLNAVSMAVAIHVTETISTGNPLNDAQIKIGYNSDLFYWLPTATTAGVINAGTYFGNPQVRGKFEETIKFTIEDFPLISGKLYFVISYICFTD